MPPLITFTFLHLDNPKAKLQIEAYHENSAWFQLKQLVKYPNMWELKK